MKRFLALSALALPACAASAQELKQANPPLRATGSLPVKIKVALPAPIVFSRGGDQKGIWKRDLDGTETRLTSHDDSSPATYNEGRIYFARKNGGSSDVWSMKRDGSGERLEFSNGYAPQPFAGALAFLRREPGELGKVWLMVKVGDDYKKVASAGWVARGYYVTRPVFEPGSGRVIAGIYEKDDGGAKPKVKIRAFNFDGTYNELWSGVANSVSGIAVYKDGSTVRRLGILAPEGQSADLWKLDGGSGSARLVADSDAESSLDATADGRLLIGAGGKLYLASKTGTSRLLVTEGYDGIWLD